MIKFYRKKLLPIILILLGLFVGIGYATLKSDLTINGTAKVDKLTWDVSFENIVLKEGSITATTPATISTDKTAVTFRVPIKTPGEYYEFTVDAVNHGNMDAMINDIIISSLTEQQRKYLDYNVTYLDGNPVEKEDLLKKNSSKTIKVSLSFKKDVNEEDLPTRDEPIFLGVEIEYVQSK